MTQSLLQRHFKTSVEGIEEGEPKTETPVLSDDVGEDSLEGELVEAQEAANQAEDTDEVAAELDEVAEGMESICSYLTDSLEKGGLTPEEAGALTLAIDSYDRRLGIEDSGMPSVESFGGATDRETATTVSIEKAEGKLRQIWEAIKDAFSKAWEGFVNLIKRLFSVSEKLTQRADSIEEAMKSDKVDFSSDAGKIKGAGTEYTENLDNLSVVNKELLGGYLDEVSGYYKELGGMPDFSKLGEEEAAKAMSEYTESIMERAEKLVDGSGKKLIGIKLPGGCTFSKTEDEKKDEGDQAPPVLVFEKPSSDPKGEDEIDALDEKTIKSYIAVTREIAKAVSEDKKSAIDKLDKERKDTISNIDKAVKNSNKGVIESAKVRVKVRWSMRATTKNYLKPVTDYCGYSTKVAKSLLALSQRSIKAHAKADGGKKDDKKEDEK